MANARAATVSGFAVQPNIADPLCNGGRGVRLGVPGAGNSIVSGATVADGSTLVAFSNVNQGSRSAVLRSVTPACASNGEFGHDGAATITIPSGLRPGIREQQVGPGIWVNAVAPRSGGGAIVAGQYGGAWVVGEVTGSGTMDRGFGTKGWVVLPFQGEVTAVLQAPSGRIVIAGDNGGGGCCTVNWAAALSASGQLEKEFGANGRAVLPTGEDSGATALALEPNGDILAEIGYGNMGCWGVALAMLTPSGRPETGFVKRLQRFWGAQHFGAFVGDIYVGGAGFTLVGTGQKPCARGSSVPPATGLIARFRTSGRLDGSAARFPSPLYGSVQAFPEGADTVVVASPYADPTHITLTAIRQDGSTDASFGSHGHARIHTPWRGPDSASGTTVKIARASPTEIVVIATEWRHNQLELLRVRL
jgi:hypothetical protein